MADSRHVHGFIDWSKVIFDIQLKRKLFWFIFHAASNSIQIHFYSSKIELNCNISIAAALHTSNTVEIFKRNPWMVAMKLLLQIAMDIQQIFCKLNNKEQNQKTNAYNEISNAWNSWNSTIIIWHTQRHVRQPILTTSWNKKALWMLHFQSEQVCLNWRGNEIGFTSQCSVLTHVQHTHRIPISFMHKWLEFQIFKCHYREIQSEKLDCNRSVFFAIKTNKFSYWNLLLLFGDNIPYEQIKYGCMNRTSMNMSACT